jgi:hypothetical protein
VKFLILISIFSTLAYLGYQHYSEQQELIQQQQQALEIYNRDKIALDVARESKDPKALYRFIHQNPDSAWRKSAQYYLEKQLVNDAVNDNNIIALKGFIRNYPDSEWKQYATDYKDKLLQQQKQKLVQETKISTNVQIEASQTTALTKQRTSISSIKPVTKKTDDARDRVNRALSIYSKINKKKSIEAERQQKERQHLAEIEQRCNKMQDQMKQFRKNVRWYELDAEGKRVYMDKESVKQQKKAMQDDFNQYCQ